MTESLPSGVLKVAEECKRLAREHAYLERTVCNGAEAMRSHLIRDELYAAIDQLAALASPPPQATASSLPVVAHLRQEAQDFEALVADGGSSCPDVALGMAVQRRAWADAIDQLRDELERKSDAIQKLWKERDEARAELAALKAAPVVDVEARAESLRDSLRLDWLERHAVGIENSGRWWSVFGDDTGAAETLRKAVDRAAGLASPEGSPR